MDLGLSGKIALVTGGSRGIGKACALALAKEGADVTISFTSNEIAAQETVDALRAHHGKGEMVRFDVGDAAAGQAAIDALVKSKGGLQVLVNNAGVAIDGLVMRFKDEDLEKIFKTNVFGAYTLSRAACRAMMKARWGRIIMMGSVVGEMGNTGQSAYAATKSALEGLSKSLARELASRNITCNVVSPGFIDTDMTKGMTETMRAALLSQIPLGAMGSAEDIADAVTWLSSERARYVTGQVLSVNGGLYM